MRRERLWAAAGLLVFAVPGAALFAGGSWLAWLGGSLYYAAAGAAMMAIGVALARGSRWAIWIHSGLVVGTIIWALFEAGVDPWALLARVGMPGVMALWFAIPGRREPPRARTHFHSPQLAAAAL